MSIRYAIVIMFCLFYLAIGIGAALKFMDKKPDLRLLFKFIVFLPIQTIVLTFMIFTDVLSVCIRRTREERKKRKMSVFRIVSAIVILFFRVLCICIEWMPIFSGRLAYVKIYNKPPIKHAIRKTKKDCIKYLDNNLLDDNIMLGFN